SKNAPVDVVGLSPGVKMVRVGQGFTCAVTAAGGAKCWGTGYLVGDGSDGSLARTTPVEGKGMTSGVTALALGDFHACVINTAGAVFCWGQQTLSGPVLGSGDGQAYNEPVQVVGLTSGYVDLTTRFESICAKKSDGSLVCWG